ncbi:MAG: hypothetical protein IKH25_06715 [Muribaculaceae bacterium]|nr:hypothetical protein [Muribaculaceae bacterium]
MATKVQKNPQISVCFNELSDAFNAIDYPFDATESGKRPEWQQKNGAGQSLLRAINPYY